MTTVVVLPHAAPPSYRVAPRPPCKNDPRWSLVIAIFGSGMAFLDGTVVNVALPVMQRDLDIAVDQVLWVVEAYSLLLASLVLVGGALGDRFGRRRVFAAGVAVFAFASIACGLAPNATALIVARAVQGVGGALLVPGSLALISAAYVDRGARGAAIGTWSAFSAMTAAIGPIAGGWVLAHASWRWLFFFNVPVAVAVIVLASLRVDESRDDTSAGPIDVLGALLATAGLGLLVFALIDGGRAGAVASGRVLSLFALGVITLVAFVVVEGRRRAPMVPLSLFRSRTFSGANALTLLLYAALSGALFFVPFNLIQVQRYSPEAAGAAQLPLIVVISVTSRWAGAVAGRTGPRLPLVVGPLVAGGGLGLLAIPTIGGAYLVTFFPGMLVLGLGMGIAVAPLTAAVMGAVDPQHAGVASGINNAVSRAAGLLAIAALGVVLVARFNAALDRSLARLRLAPDVAMLVDRQRARLGGADFPARIDPTVRVALRRAFDDAYVSGFRTLMIICAVLAALGALAAFWLVDKSPRRDGCVAATPNLARVRRAPR